MPAPLHRYPQDVVTAPRLRDVDCVAFPEFPVHALATHSCVRRRMAAVVC